MATGVDCRSAVALDLDGDGLLDVLGSDRIGQRVVVYHAPSWTPYDVAHDVAPISMQTWDVDGDGLTDVVGGDFRPGQVFWLQQPPQPFASPWSKRFIDRAAAGGSDGVHSVLVANVDEEPTPELVVTSNLPEGALPNSIVAYKRPAALDEASWPRMVLADRDAPGFVHYLAMADVFGTGHAQLFTGAKVGNTFMAWQWPGVDGVPWTPKLIAAAQPGATHLYPADLDGNGQLDLVGARGHGEGLVGFLAPTFTPFAIDTTLKSPHALATGDVDRDGDLDLASCGSDSNELAWFENDGHARFRKHTISLAQRSYEVRLVDRDGDGDLDVLVSGEKTGNLAWYENVQAP